MCLDNVIPWQANVLKNKRYPLVNLKVAKAEVKILMITLFISLHCVQIPIKHCS